MSNVVVVGSQWGDEGKGKIVDWLSSRADVVVRFQGGHNAGHTLVIDGKVYKLSLLPSGIVRPDKVSVIGNGVVLDPVHLLKEITQIREQGVDISPANLKIAENVPLILSVHRSVDQAREAARGKNLIGTTGRGIGPAYEDKVGRRAIRLCDLAHPETLADKVDNLLSYHNTILAGLGAEPVTRDSILDELNSLASEVLPYACVAWKDLETYRKERKRVLFEGAQGILLDIDHGTYPFVTSSNTSSAQSASGAGVGPGYVGYVLGITKAYTTRVGSGPFPTELFDDVGRGLGERGHEFGTVTGRERRCGWFDATLVRQTCKVAGMSGIALTKLDVMDGMEEIKIGIGYDINGERYDHLPATAELQAVAKPIYETLQGWTESTYGARSWADLPANAIKYIRRIEELIETPVAVLSTSPERDDTILVKDPFE